MLFTRESYGVVGKIHHRMPVLLENDSEIEDWLDNDKYTYNEIIEKLNLNKKKEIWDCLKCY